MTTDAPLVEARQLGVTYKGGTHALRAVDLTLRAGEFVSIVGQSGCGKSTLLRIVAGLLQASSGSLTVAGLLPVEARRQATRTSFVFQEATLLPWRRIADNVCLPLELLSVARGEQIDRMQRGLAMVGLTEFADRYPRQLSGGMRMRVSLKGEIAAFHTNVVKPPNARVKPRAPITKAA